MKPGNILAGVILTVIGGAIAVGTVAGEAKALERPIGALQSTVAFSCGTTATPFPPDGTTAHSVTLVNSTGSNVFVGGSNVTTSAESSVGPTSAFGTTFRLDGKKGWCIAASAENVTLLYGVQ